MKTVEYGTVQSAGTAPNAPDSGAKMMNLLWGPYVKIGFGRPGRVCRFGRVDVTNSVAGLARLKQPPFTGYLTI